MMHIQAKFKELLGVLYAYALKGILKQFVLLLNCSLKGGKKSHWPVCLTCYILLCFSYTRSDSWHWVWSTCASWNSCWGPHPGWPHVALGFSQDGCAPRPRWVNTIVLRCDWVQNFKWFISSFKSRFWCFKRDILCMLSWQCCPLLHMYDIIIREIGRLGFGEITTLM